MTTQRRRPWGIPAGGEFAPRSRAESDSTLTAIPLVQIPWAEVTFTDLEEIVEREAALLGPAPNNSHVLDRKVNTIPRNRVFETQPTRNEDAETLLDQINDGEISSGGARSLLWNVFSSEWGVPRVYPGTISRRTALVARREILRLGGVNSVCENYLRDENVDLGVRAAMSPFGYCSPDTIHAVCSLLSSRGRLASKPWESALIVASAPRYSSGLTAPHT